MASAGDLELDPELAIVDKGPDATVLIDQPTSSRENPAEIRGDFKHKPTVVEGVEALHTEAEEEASPLAGKAVGYSHRTPSATQTAVSAGKSPSSARPTRDTRGAEVMAEKNEAEEEEEEEKSDEKGKNVKHVSRPGGTPERKDATADLNNANQVPAAMDDVEDASHLYQII